MQTKLIQQQWWNFLPLYFFVESLFYNSFFNFKFMVVATFNASLSDQ